MSPALAFSAILLALAASSGMQLRRTRARRLLIERTPLTPAAEVRSGHVEIQGRIAAEATIRTPVGAKEAVHVGWELQEERGRAFHTVRSEERRLPFFLADASGRVRIVPGKAELIYRRDLLSDPTTFEAAPAEVRELALAAGLTAESLGERRIRLALTYLEPGDELWICGKARPGRDGVPVIEEAEAEMPFLISDRKEASVVERLARAERTSLLGAAALATIAALFALVGLG